MPSSPEAQDRADAERWRQLLADYPDGQVVVIPAAEWDRLQADSAAYNALRMGEVVDGWKLRPVSRNPH